MSHAIVMAIDLTDAERARVRRELYAEKIKDWNFILESLTDANQTLADLIKSSIANGESFILLRAMQESIKLYIESELVEEAERDFLDSKL